MAGNNPTRKRKRRPDERPLEIASAALKLFSSHGYHLTTMDDIAAAAGVTKGAIYHHFESKEQLLEFALKTYFDSAFERATRSSGTSNSVIEYIRNGLLDAAVELWTSDEFTAVFCLAFGDVGRSMPQIRRQFITSGPLRGWKELAKAIAEGQRQHIFRNDISADDAARTVSSSIALQCILHRAMCPDKIQLRKAAMNAVDTALMMLSIVR